MLELCGGPQGLWAWIVYLWTELLLKRQSR